jgi:hypothetical protein
MCLDKQQYHQRGETIMAQGILPFKYEEEKKITGMTALAGLPLYLELAQKAGLSKSIQQHIKVRKNGQGWSDSQMLLSLILLNLAGGSCVDDLRVLEADNGFCEILKKAELHGLKHKERRAQMKRWRKDKTRTVPSSSATFRYLAAFHDAGQEKQRQASKAFIPEPNEHLKGFALVNREVATLSYAQTLGKIATLDMDATLVETHKSEALYCYKGYRSYQPLNTWWAEQGILLHTEFRDGNVPAGYEQLRVFIEALACLPAGVAEVRLRSDTAGYQHNLLKYCEMGTNERFGRIEFAIGCNVTQEFKHAVAEVPEADWYWLYKTVDGKRQRTKTQWAEVCFVPNGMGYSKKGSVYRYIAKREALTEQLALPGMDSQPTLPFQTIALQDKCYKLFGIVTNMDWAAEELINWQHERCGKSEEVHAVMKHDLAGGRFPSGDFGENAAWWWIMVLAHNLNAVLKRQALGKAWVSKRMKAVRYSIINLPGRVLNRSRSLIVRLTQNHPSYELLIEARKRIAMLVPATG